jgi:hypothetical protein
MPVSFVFPFEGQEYVGMKRNLFILAEFEGLEIY